MSDLPYALNLNELGVEPNKDIIKNQILSLYYVHKAGRSHGNGLFARRNIFKDEEVIRVSGPTVGAEVQNTLYWSYGIDILIQISLGKYMLPKNEARFINHSCEPNLGFHGAGVFVAMRDIREKEELTYDYSIGDIDSDYVIDCLCGTKSCRKKITGLDIFNEKYNLARKYKGYIPGFVLREISIRKTSSV